MQHEVGPFHIEREIGRGGSAVVYAARKDGRPVALKVPFVPDEDAGRRFLEEARKLGAIDHPGVVPILETGLLPDGRPYLAMPLLAGETLAARLARGPLDQAQALLLFAGIAEAAHVLHQAGMVHRDIKTENVYLVDADPPRPVLLDLGIAKGIADGPSRTTEQGVVRGTPATMAPERFFGQQASVASDVYELALLLYAMLTARLPWPDDADVEDRLAAQPAHEIEPSISEALSDAIMTALATRPTKRPATALELLESVRAASAAAPEPRRTSALEVSRPPAAKLEVPTGRAIVVPAMKEEPVARTAPWRTIALVAIGGFVGAAVVAAIGRRDDGAPASASAAASVTSSSAASASVASASTSASVAPSSLAASVAEAPSASITATAALPSAVPGAASASAIAPMLPSASGSAESAAPFVLASTFEGRLAQYPSCKKYWDYMCKHHTCHDRATADRWMHIHEKKPERIERERKRNEESCAHYYESKLKDDEPSRRADQVIATQLPACARVKAKACDPALAKDEATAGKCKQESSSLRHLVQNRTVEESAKNCEWRLQSWDKQLASEIESYWKMKKQRAEDEVRRKADKEEAERKKKRVASPP